MGVNMATTSKKKGMSDKTKWILMGAAGFLVFLIGFVMVFGTPSAETVFKDMNEQMLKTKSVTVDQTMAVVSNDGSAADISAKLYMNMNSSTEMLASGSFSMNMTSGASPISVSGDLIKIGDTEYVKYGSLSSTEPSLSPSFKTIETKLMGSWIKVRTNDQFASLAATPAKFTSSVIPTPYANLTDTQRKDVLAILQDKKMYTIDESAKVETGGVSAYKYTLTYNKDQFNKMADAIVSDVKYFKNDSSTDSKITSFIVWANISTKQIIKIEYTGSSTTNGNVRGTMSFSGYNEVKTVEKPNDYFIESELLN